MSDICFKISVITILSIIAYEINDLNHNLKTKIIENVLLKNYLSQNIRCKKINKDNSETNSEVDLVLIDRD